MATQTPTQDQHLRHAHLGNEAASLYRQWTRARDEASNFRRTSTYTNLDSRKQISDLDKTRYDELEAVAVSLDSAAASVFDQYRKVAREHDELGQQLSDAAVKTKQTRQLESMGAPNYRVIKARTIAGSVRHPGEVITAQALATFGLTAHRVRHLESLGLIVGLHGEVTS